MTPTLTEKGRKQFDMLQKNLSSIITSSDAELAERGSAFDEMFGGGNDPETQRQEARKTQEKLDLQGREAFAEEYAETQIKNQTL